MSLNDLLAKAQALEAQRIELEAQIEAARVKHCAIEAIKADMQSAGVTIEDLGYGSIKPARDKPFVDKQLKWPVNSTKGQRIAPKFKGPNGETWSGRGMKPRWLKQALTGGASQENFRIAA